jgi:hypothetical protein
MPRFLHLPLCLALLSGAAVAAPSYLPGEAEYREAAPQLDEIDRRMMALANQREPNGAMNQALRQALLDYLRAHVADIHTLLETASAAGNPAAEYRLARLLEMANDPASHARACTLLQSSLARGFTPAALQMRDSCPEAIDTPTYIAQVKALPAIPTPYARYYPQPSNLPPCLPPSGNLLDLQSLDEPAFRANLYYSMREVLVDAGAQTRQARLAYPLQAQAYGCPRIEGWLARQK